METHMNKIRKFAAGNPTLEKNMQWAEENKSARKQRILIIDDEPAMLNLLISFLNKKYEVDSAMEGEAALQKIISQQYDVILSDIHLPGLTGIDILKEAQNTDKDIGKKFIFITGDTSPVYKRFFEQNEIFYLYKPVSLDIVEDRIQEILSK
jgi:putative two-component system response regulator